MSAAQFSPRASGWEELTSGFLTMLAVERGLSANTLTAYSSDLAGLRRYCESNHHQLAALEKPAVIVAWLESMFARDISRASRWRYYSTAKRFSAYLVRLGVLKTNAASALKLRRSVRPLPRVPSRESLETLIQSIAPTK